jgi:transposase
MPTMTAYVRKTASMSPAAEVRPRRDFAAMEARRMQAADLFAKKVSQAEIARELGVAHQTVSDWHDQWLVGGKRALKRVGKPGRPPKVTTQDLAKVEKALERGPRANGFATDLWTLARVAEVIETVTGVQYHPGHVWRVLRQMGWSRQRPARQAIERDDAIERWVNERWPKVKKTPQPGGRGSSSKTRAASASSRSSAPPGPNEAAP